ncbi:hypothetical protein ACIRG5_46110 [Lentzea sp. NPDC102401]|uniref:hypothetical protein n=1 Tax=Lentzea sp. NPDC102401 TaxID=3364128 RepID=UPI003806906C
MKLVLAVPINLRGFVRIAHMATAVVTSLICMYLLFGLVGLLVLAVELLWLGCLLLKAAHGE